MSDVESTTVGQKPRSNAWQSAVTVVQEAQPPFIPVGAHDVGRAGPSGTLWNPTSARHYRAHRQGEADGSKRAV